MKRETQALHLAKMMQKHTSYPAYELILPLVTVRSNKLKKLSEDDVLLIGFDRLELLLSDGDTICAKLQLSAMKNVHRAEVIALPKDRIKKPDSTKYKNIKILLGSVQSKTLELGSTIDITHIDFENVNIVSDDEIIAEGTLVNVDDEMAIQIKKVK